MATYNGTSARNVWNGTSSADTAYGNGGDDSLYGKGGNDILYGDAGNDGLYGDDGNDTLWGGDGIDALTGGSGADTLRGGNGDDYILGGIGGDGLYGDAGNDRLRGEDGIDALFGGAGADDLQGGSGDDYLDGGTEDDVLVGGDGTDRLRGGDGNDLLNGGAGSNDLQGGNGNDTLVHFGRPLVDLPNGTAFYDGGAGADTLLFDIQGVVTEHGDDHAYLLAYVGQDGKGGVDHATNPDEPNTIRVGTFSGIEIFRMESSDNILSFSTSSTVTVYGGSAGDRLEGMIGDQTFVGGAGDDHYRFMWRDGWNSGQDKVVGFSESEGDWIGYSNMPESGEGPETAVTAVETGGHTIFTTTVVLTGEVVHTLDVDAVGLQDRVYFDYYLG